MQKYYQLYHQKYSKKIQINQPTYLLKIQKMLKALFWTSEL